MAHYELVKITIDTAGLAKIIINVVVRYYSFSKTIFHDQDLLFNAKFWFLLCYFLDIKQKIFTVFYS